nr:uncharacterized protein CI109_004238 [Kwoniella shandongensis]KAA5527422.1 hypothetical protein CI109_004238 [Kwoniella shandongensis]
MSISNPDLTVNPEPTLTQIFETNLAGADARVGERNATSGQVAQRARVVIERVSRDELPSIAPRLAAIVSSHMSLGMSTYFTHPYTVESALQLFTSLKDVIVDPEQEKKFPPPLGGVVLFVAKLVKTEMGEGVFAESSSASNTVSRSIDSSGSSSTTSSPPSGTIPPSTITTPSSTSTPNSSSNSIQSSSSITTPSSTSSSTSTLLNQITQTNTDNDALLPSLDMNGNPTPHPEIIGSVQLAFASMPNGAFRSEVRKMLVDVRYGGRGVGKALLGKLEDEAREWGSTICDGELVGMMRAFFTTRPKNCVQVRARGEIIPRRLGSGLVLKVEV